MLFSAVNVDFNSGYIYPEVGERPVLLPEAVIKAPVDEMAEPDSILKRLHTIERFHWMAT